MQVLRFLQPNVKQEGGVFVVAVNMTDASTYYSQRERRRVAEEERERETQSC